MKQSLMPKGGRSGVLDRVCLTVIIFVRKRGIPWGILPQEMGCGSGVTCWRRPRDWQAAGVRDRLNQTLLDRLGDAGRIDWSLESLDSASVPEKRGAAVGPNPTDRGKPGTKRYLIVERGGIPLAARLTGANRHDSMVFEEVIYAVPTISGPSGRRRKRPAKPHADKAYDILRCRRFLRRRRIKVRIARKGVDSSQRLGRYRRGIERTMAWLAGIGG